MTGPVSDMVPSTPIFEMYPLGLTSLGEYLERHGFSSRIYNLACKMLYIPSFDVERSLAGIDSPVVGIDLHWMPHCQGAIEVARIVKRLHPDCHIELGGHSSSVFHRELIEYDCVDFVFRGDSTEEPLRMLMSRVMQARKTKTPLGDLSDIPNLTWKDDAGNVHVNDLCWVPDDFDAPSLDYTYPMKGAIRHRDLLSFLPFKGWLQYPVCCDIVSRGCSRNCVTCGGSAHAYREYLGRKRPAWRSPEMLVRDIAHAQSYIGGPFFILNDPLLAGPDYVERFITGLKGRLNNPIGFEFFGPPEMGDDLYRLFDENLPDWSVEISAESHDDSIRAAFGKGHYTMAELETTILDALSHPNCSRFDLYFMTGIPTQTADSVRETGDYVRHLYELVGFDPRLVVMTSPMAPLLDVGSMAFDDPGKYGYRLRAHTLEEHRERMLMPTWKHILNYESMSMNVDEMCETTYEAALDINRVKWRGGVIDPAQGAATEKRILAAMEGMKRIDEMLLDESPLDSRAVHEMRDRWNNLNENTVANKDDLNWPHSLKPTHIAHLAKITTTQTLSQMRAMRTGALSSAASDLPYHDQTYGIESAVNPPSDEMIAKWGMSRASRTGVDPAPRTRVPARDHGRRDEVGRVVEEEMPLPPVPTRSSATVDTATGKPADGSLSTNRVQSIFSRIAPRYDLFNALSSLGMYRYWLDMVVKRAAVKPDEVLLDIAAGTGDITFGLCASTPPLLAVVTDFNEAMLDEARRRYDAGASHGVECLFATEDGQALSFDDDTFDVVTCGYGIRNMPDRERALSEAYRVLRPGGRFVVLEFSTPPNPAWRSLYHVYLDAVIPNVGGLVAGDRPGFVYLRDSIRAFPDQVAFKGLLEKAGFTSVEYVNCTGGIVAIHTAVK